MWLGKNPDMKTSPKVFASILKYYLDTWKLLNAVSSHLDDLSNQISLLDNNTQVQGPLKRMPLGVKDNYCVAGSFTTCGSKMLENFRPSYTATIVDRLQKSGMIVTCKTNMDSFAMGSGTFDSYNGPTKNPWSWFSGHKPRLGIISSSKELNESEDFYIAGGSSGGSAAAVAAGMVYGALGSDTGGSIRVPAAYCGVVGLKPTYGLLSRHGLIALVNSLDCPGIFTQTVDQCAHMLNACAGHDPMDSTTYHSRTFEPIVMADEPSMQGVTVGIPKEYHAEGTSPEILEAWDKMADLMESAGAKLVSVSLPHTRYSIACYSVLNCCEVASNMARYDGIEFGHRSSDESSTESLYAQTRHEGFSEVVRGRIFAGNYFLLRKNYEEYYIQANRLRRLVANDFQSAFSHVNVLLTPTTISTAPLRSTFQQEDNRSQSAAHDVYTQPSNLAGVPAISVPVGLSKSAGIPVSLQLIAPQFHEQRLLNVAKWMEQQVSYEGLPLIDGYSEDGGS